MRAKTRVQCCFPEARSLCISSKKDTVGSDLKPDMNSLEFPGRQHTFFIQAAFGETSCLLKGVLQSL